MSDGFEPYWVFINYERLPHVGAGLRMFWVKIEGRKVRWKRVVDAPRARVMTLKRWEAIPHVLYEGQNMCTIHEALQAYGELRGETPEGASCQLRARKSVAKAARRTRRQ